MDAQVSFNGLRAIYDEDSWTNSNRPNKHCTISSWNRIEVNMGKHTFNGSSPVEPKWRNWNMCAEQLGWHGGMRRRYKSEMKMTRRKLRCHDERENEYLTYSKHNRETLGMYLLIYDGLPAKSCDSICCRILRLVERNWCARETYSFSFGVVPLKPLAG